MKTKVIALASTLLMNTSEEVNNAFNMSTEKGQIQQYDKRSAQG